LSSQRKNAFKGLEKYRATRENMAKLRDELKMEYGELMKKTKSFRRGLAA